MSGGDREQLVSIGGRRLRVTNLGKVMYPDTGTTKGEVIEYYTRIAPLMIPHVIGRPITRKRWVEGVGTDDEPGAVFFAKDLERGAPSWVARLPIPHSGGPKTYPLAADVPTLVYLAQVASLELHVPQWRFTADGQRGDADRLVLDLDPGPGAGLRECALVAGWARSILSDMGLTPYPVTSGSKGIHLYAALPPGQTSEQASMIAKELARSIESDHGDLVVSSMKKSEREGKVLIDWSQNNGAKTTIAPYSLRGRAQPTVAAPRTWDELDDPDLRHLLFDEVLDRLDTVGDPMSALGFHAGGRSSDAGPLSTYISKRSASRTPEPVPANALGSTPHSEKPIFVIQEHHASRLHWDFRLEHDGVLVSWAVPRGVPHTTTRNSLAVMTEDHPMEYATFEGTIPAGEYGGGDVTIWDDGRYDLEKWRDDEIIVTVEGRAGGPLGRVRLALIRTEGEGEKSSWLLHRMKTDATGTPQRDGEPVVARGADDPPELAPDSEPDRRPDPQPAAARDTAPMLATSATPGIARAAAERWAGTHPAWAEMKWDGVRALGLWDGTRLQLRARSGNDITAKYPELTAVPAGLGPDPAILDGEIVALDAQGRPSFSLLQKRMNLAQQREIQREMPRTPVRYYLFDVLSVAGDDVAAKPLDARRALLEHLAAEAIDEIVVPPVFDDVSVALQTSQHFGLEGIVVKDPGSRYERGERSERWLKVKLTGTQEVVIGGIRPGKGSRSGSIGSLLVGVFDGESFQYAGRVGSGFSERMLRHLSDTLTPLRTDTNPFEGVPAADASDALWVRPELVGEVEYAEFTPGGILRHARWRGLRPDKSPAEARREDGAR
jgi:bifunctional non-homologous end joining protein LigD